MWAAPPWPLDAMQIYDEVTARRRPASRAVLARERSDIEAAYARYAAAADAPETLVGLDPIAANKHADTRSLLRKNYKRFKQTHELLFGAMQLSVPRCLMCGEGTITGLDHFLPHSAFAEFAVLPINLIPACARCNGEKDDDYLDEHERPIFLHALFDRLGATSCVKANLDTATGIALFDFEVVCPAGMADDLAGRIERQFAKLQLPQRYSDAADQDASVRSTEVHIMLHEDKMTPQQVSESLHRAVRGRLHAFGPNHWSTVALQALASSPDFCSGKCNTTMTY